MFLISLDILLLLFLHILLLCHMMLDFSIPSGCPTVWIQIKPDILLGLIWVRTVCKGYISRQQKSPLAGRVKYKATCWYYTFWLKPRLKLISFGSNIFYLARVLCTNKFWARARTQNTRTGNWNTGKCIWVIVKIRQNSCPFHILWKPLMWSWIFLLHTILLIILNKASW